MDGKCRRGGFTLPELLVAMVVMSVIMLSVGALFVASIGAAKSGYQGIDANNESRTLFSTLERDINTAFTSRDYGAYYQFYGTPIGMSFVGTVRAYEKTDSAANLGRVTYVLHLTPEDEGPSYFTTKVLDEMGTPDDATDDEWKEAYVMTCSLLRYYESGVSDLDSYPVNWKELRSDPEFNYAKIDSEFSAIENLANMGWDQKTIEELLRAKKRQLWIRMLSETNLNLGSDSLPRFFSTDDDTGLITNKAEDYILTDNILLGVLLMSDAEKRYETYLETHPDGTMDDLMARLQMDLLRLDSDDHLYAPDDYDANISANEEDSIRDLTILRKRAEFQYGFADAGRTITMPYWNADGSLPSTKEFTYENSYADTHSGYRKALSLGAPVLAYPEDPESPLWGASLKVGALDETVGDSSYNHLFPFSSADVQGESGIVTPHPIWRAFLPHPSNYVDDQNNKIEYRPGPEQRSPMAAKFGTPLNPRLPEMVYVRGRLAYKSTHIGGSDLFLPIDYLMDVPVGQMRTKWWAS